MMRPSYPATPAAGRRACLCALLAAMLLGGCAGMVRAPATPPAARADEAGRTYHQSIDLNGRLSVRYQRNGKEEAVHGSFSWTQSPQLTRVTLLSPLGQIVAVIDVTPDGAAMQQANQRARAAADVDTLAAESLGWPLPVAGLQQWLQGFGTDRSGRRFIATPQAGDAEFATADGWRIRFAAWEPESSSARPKRIDLQRTTEQAGDVSIRIAVDGWQVR